MIHEYNVIFVDSIKPEIHRLTLFCCHYTIYALKPSQGMYREKKIDLFMSNEIFYEISKVCTESASSFIHVTR